MTDSQLSLLSDDLSDAPNSLVPPSSLSIAPDEINWKGNRWFHIDETAKQRRNAPRSKIWDHGSEYRKEANIHLKAWRCGYCLQDYLVVYTSDATSNCRRHLAAIHNMELDKSKGKNEEEEEQVPVERQLQLRSLVQSVNVDNFRFHMLRWIVECHIPFSIVEDQNFQLMMKSVNSTVQDYLVKSGDTIRNWMEDEFMEARLIVRNDVLAK